MSHDGASAARPAGLPPGRLGRLAPWLLVPLGWLLAALLFSTRPGNEITPAGIRAIPWRHIFVDSLIRFGWWVALAPAVVLVVSRIGRWFAAAWLRVMAHLVAAMLFVGLYFLLRAHLRVPGARYYIGTDWRGLVTVLPDAVATYVLLAGAVLALEAHRRWREREHAAARLEAELTSTRLDLLRAQLHPHFLFNALHAVAALVDGEPRQARRMLARLADLLRLAVEAADLPEVSLAREVEWLERYLEFQHIRFDHRLDAQLRIAPELLGAAVPALVLQPLVENAIKHAVEPRPGGGRVVVSAERDGPWLRLRVCDDGPGPGASPHREGGVGLRNTRERLRALYGERFRLELRPGQTGGAEAVVELPLREAPLGLEGSA